MDDFEKKLAELRIKQKDRNEGYGAGFRECAERVIDWIETGKSVDLIKAELESELRG